MNVQIANKCQFLPQVALHFLCGCQNCVIVSQDMVVEFARMNSYELLEETEKTVSQTLYILRERS